MPASVIPPYQCKCTGCVALAGPMGRRIPGKDRISHLNRVKAELEQQANLSVADPESNIFVSTLVDNVPASTAVEDEIDPQETHPSSNDPFSFTSFLDTLPSYTSSSSSPSAAQTPTDEISTSISEHVLTESSPAQTLSKTLPTGVPKAERNALTSKAHASLDVLEQKIERCLEKVTSLVESNITPPAVRLLTLEGEIAAIQKAFDKVTRTVNSVVNRKKAVKQRLDELHSEFEGLRRLHDGITDDKPLAFDSSRHFSMPINDHDSIAQITMFIPVLYTVLVGIGRNFGDLLLGLLRVLLRRLFLESNRCSTTTPSQDDILDEIPKTIDTAMKKFNLDCQTVTYAVCPECNCTYAPRFRPGAPDIPIYPTQCSNRPTPETTCSANLLDNSTSPATPLKKYRYHSFHDYVSSLFARSDVEDFMDKACDDLARDIENGKPSKTGPVTDFFQGEYIRTFKGPDKKLFIKRPKDEGRLCFVFNVDYFNAEGQSIRGPSASIGLISGACLNLPLDIRYKPENMFLAGIIPGPSEPTLTEINHFIRYLVDDLLVAWERGVRLSRTANHPNGRLVRSAAAIFINDLPAARQVNCSASYTSHNYCHSCSCVNVKTLARTDIDADVWRPRDAFQLRKLAEAWKNAPTTAEREQLFTENGYRWTELWRLPYYDPARMLAVDSMHCLLEGLVQYHFRFVLSLTDPDADATEHKPPAFDFDFANPEESWYNIYYKPNAEGRRHVNQIHKLLLSAIGEEGDHEQQLNDFFAKLSKRLETKTLPSLRFVSQNVNPARASSCKLKSDYIRVLVEWRKKFPLRADFDPRSHIKWGTVEAMERIREVILDMDTPSWLRSVPLNFGAPAAGSLKADEWRTMATVYLPVALVSLWGEGSTHASDNIASGRRRALDHTMNLVSAVILACKGTMTQQIMAGYRDQLSRWRVDLTRLHPEAKHTPNSHMAVHIYEYLKLFGPVRSWWCFPFERMIGQLQRLGSNHQYGDLEITLAESYRKAAKLRQWFQRKDSPDFLKECQQALFKVFPATSLEGQAYSIANTAFQRVPTELESILKDHDKVAFRAHHRVKDVIYSRSSTHVGNSLILFFPDATERSEPIPGSIEHIAVLPNRSVLYLVRRQLPAHATTVNPFLPYPYFDAMILLPKLSDSLEVVQPDRVVAHYARWVMDPQRVVALPLYKRN